MGRATILSGGTNGLYTIDYRADGTRMQARIDRIAEIITGMTEIDIPRIQAAVDERQQAYDDTLADLNAAIAAKEETKGLVGSLNAASDGLISAKRKLDTKKAKLASLKQQKKFLEDNLPPAEQIPAWCADLTESLTGEVGTIEIPGERTAPVIIRPGGSDGLQAAYDSARDGQIVPCLALSPAENFYNLAMLPGWQKHQPTCRLGTITNINGNLCDVSLDAAVSSQQALDVNASNTLTNVPITYLTCNGAAFEVGDRVVVAYTGSGPGTVYTPAVIGFESNPKGCGGTAVIVSFISLSKQKTVLGALGATNSEAHAAFLATPWPPAWTQTGNHLAWYTAADGDSFPAVRFLYRASKTKRTFQISGNGTYTLAVQAKHSNLFAFQGRSMVYLESDPLRLGYLDAGDINVWRTMFLLTEADAGTVDIIMEDGDSYPVIPEPVAPPTAEKGWKGSEEVRIIQI